MLDEVERLMGYGSANFTKSLVETYRRLAEKELHDGDLEQVRLFGERIRTQPLQLLDGVRETLRVSILATISTCSRRAIMRSRGSRSSGPGLRCSSSNNHCAGKERRYLPQGTE